MKMLWLISSSSITKKITRYMGGTWVHVPSEWSNNTPSGLKERKVQSHFPTRSKKEGISHCCTTPFVRTIPSPPCTCYEKDIQNHFGMWFGSSAKRLPINAFPPSPNNCIRWDLKTKRMYPNVCPFKTTVGFLEWLCWTLWIKLYKTCNIYTFTR